MVSFRWRTPRVGYLARNIGYQEGKPMHPEPKRFRLWGVMFGRTFIGVMSRQSAPLPVTQEE
jgi:hypothetical protein